MATFVHVPESDREARFLAEIERLKSADKEKLAAWMIKNGFATGHGDSIEDLLKELAWQIEEQIQRVAGRGAN